MKGTVVITTILCGGLLFGGNVINKNTKIENVNNNALVQKQITNQADTVQEVKAPTKNEITNIENVSNNTLAQKQITNQVDTVQEVKAPTKNEITNIENVSNNTLAQKQIPNQVDTVQEVKSLTKNDALNILLKNNNNLTYLYQGDESSFETLKEKGLSGYVFLPDIDTDMGYFVDKNTKEVYYFHPSGYLELMK